MTDKPACETCLFWAADTKHSGWCHRFPPETLPGIEPVSLFPETAAAQWCGEHQPPFTGSTGFAGSADGRQQAAARCPDCRSTSLNDEGHFIHQTWCPHMHTPPV